MKISWIKSSKDNESFNFARTIGFDLIELDDLDRVDEKIQELIDNNCKTIVMTNEVASFSEDIMKKYYKDNLVKIIIAPSKK